MAALRDVLLKRKTREFYAPGLLSGKPHRLRQSEFGSRQHRPGPATGCGLRLCRHRPRRL